MSLLKSKTVLKNLRNAMRSTAYVPQCLQAYIIPSNDAHQSEYLGDCDQRRQYISGFSGSAGTAVVTMDKAALWTDGRYYLQAEKELSSEWILMKEGQPDVPSEAEWLSKVLPCGSFIGVDPFLVSNNVWRKYSSTLEPNGLSLIDVSQNLVDIIWEEKPSPSSHPLEVLALEYTGMSFEKKIECVRKDMREKKASILVVTALDEIAWLLNLRGSDIPYNPVFFAYVVITLNHLHLFIDESKLTNIIKDYLKSNGLTITIHPYEEITQFMSSIDKNENVWINNQSSHALVSSVPNENRISDLNPIALKKAVKNEREIACMKNAHVKDAVAVCEFLHWMDNYVGKIEITEESASEKLESFRRIQCGFVGPSFETISGSGPNGAIIHYKLSSNKSRAVSVDQLYLCDSGGQYKDGTTDITRTLHFGNPSDYEKECYTRVLKGHISLSSALFPKFIKGHMLDSFARKALWDVGLDYSHGTGHGVGMYLNVHEGPMGIGFRINPDDPGLREGMILSIEPGFYEANKFGMRIENLAVIVEAKPKYDFQSKIFLTFEPLTLVPIQTKLLIPSLLTKEEIDWLNNYHNQCREVVGKALEEQGKREILQWLMKETMPIG